MALDDLDLEFEDEDEVKKKKSEAVQVDVDLEFSTPVGVADKSRPQAVKNPNSSPPQTATSPPKNAPPLQKNNATVANINDARAAKVVATSPPKVSSVNQGQTISKASNQASSPGPKVSGSQALSEDQAYFEGQQLLEMQEHVKKVEFEAEVKVAIAEFKTEFLSEFLSDSKLMQYQVEQLLVRINSKHPDLKQEVLLLKKILADFTAKKRK